MFTFWDKVNLTVPASRQALQSTYCWCLQPGDKCLVLIGTTFIAVEFSVLYEKKSNKIQYSPFSFPPGQQTGVHACQEQSDCPLQITTLFLCPKVEETSSRDLQCAWTQTFSIVMLAVSYFMLCFYRWSRLMPLCVLNRIWSMCCFIRCIHQAV